MAYRAKKRVKKMRACLTRTVSLSVFSPPKWPRIWPLGGTFQVVIKVIPQGHTTFQTRHPLNVLEEFSVVLQFNYRVNNVFTIYRVVS